MPLHRLLLLTIAGTFGCVVAASAATAVGGLNFDSPSVLNLSLRPFRVEGQLLSPESLTAPLAEAILSEAEVGVSSDLLDSAMETFDCGRQKAMYYSALGRDCEPRRLAVAQGAAKRSGHRLEIRIDAGLPVAFIDLVIPATEGRQGDAYLFAYLGRLQGSGYHRVQEEFSEDAPGSFLINARNGRVAFVSEVDELVSPSPDGLHVITIDPHGLIVRVAALDASGPREELTCAASRTDKSSSVAFKGWRDSTTFDLVVETGDAKARKKIALRAASEAGVWRIATNGSAALTAAGFGCTTPGK